MTANPLELEGVIGFSGKHALHLQPHEEEHSLLCCTCCPIAVAGKIKHSLILHPDDTHIIYPLGSTIVIKNVENTEKQVFLQGVSLHASVKQLPLRELACRCEAIPA